MTAILDAWALVTGLRLQDHFHLAEWHLWAVLLVMGVAGGFGVHYLWGHILRFYWRGGRFQWWIAILGMPMLMLSTLALLWSYVLATGAPRLVERLLHETGEGKPTLSAEIGAYLLQPAFDRAQTRPGASGPTREQLSQALMAIPGNDLRTALGAPKAEEGEPPAPAAEPPKANGETAPGESQEEQAAPPAEEEEVEGPVPVILSIVQEWITDPGQSWPKLPPGEGEPPPAQAAGPPLSPAEFILSLIGEIPAEAALSEPEWAYVAGERFDERLLRPLLLEYFEISALALAILIVLLNVGYFWTISRMNRPPAAKASGTGKASGTAKPKASPASAPLPHPAAPPPAAEAPKREVKGP